MEIGYNIDTEIEEHGENEWFLLFPDGDYKTFKSCWCVIYEILSKVIKNSSIQSNLDITIKLLKDDIYIAYYQEEKIDEYETRWNIGYSGLAILFSKSKDITEKDLSQFLQK